MIRPALLATSLLPLPAMAGDAPDLSALSESEMMALRPTSQAMAAARPGTAAEGLEEGGPSPSEH